LILVALLAMGSFERTRQPKWLVASAATAGLAFATKYLSITLVPVFLWVVFKHARTPEIALAPTSSVRVSRACRATLGIIGGCLLTVGLAADPLRLASALAEDGRVDFPGGAEMARVVSGLLLASGVVAMGLSLWRRPWRRFSENRRAVSLAVWALVGAGAFLLAFIIVSPYSLYHLFLVKGLLLVCASLLFGEGASWQGFAADAAGPSLVPVLAGVGLALRSFAAAKDESPELKLTLAWCAICALVLALIRWPAEQYLLPLYPFAAVLAVVGVQGAAAMAAFRFRAAPSCGRELACGLLLLMAASRVPGALDRWLHRFELNGAIPLGRSMEARYDKGVTVLYDQSSYVPASFTQARPTWGGTRALLDEFAPDVVVVRHQPPTDVTDEVREYYACLSSETCGYRVAISNEFGAVLERIPSAPTASKFSDDGGTP
jgi:hypothetical protein